MIQKEALEILNTAKDILKNHHPLQFSTSFGMGLSERCIETPWVASYIKGGEKILDVGFTMSSHDYLGLLMELTQNYNITLEAVDIVEPQKVIKRYPPDWVKNILKVPVTLGDLRKMPLPNDRYDIVTCISTIEHIGFDTAASKDNQKTAFNRALKAEDVQMFREKKD